MVDPIRSTELYPEADYGNVSSFLVNTDDYKTRRLDKSLVPGSAGDSHATETGNPHNATAIDIGADPSGTASQAIVSHVAEINPHPVYTNPTRPLLSEIDDGVGDTPRSWAAEDVKSFIDVHGYSGTIDGDSTIECGEVWDTSSTADTISCGEVWDA